MFLLIMLLVGALFVFLFGAIYLYECSGFSGIFSFETMKVGIWLLFDFAPNEKTFEDFDVLAYIGHFLGFLYACIVSGMSVAILSAPINVIKFSRYAILDFEQRKLIFRYWIRKPEGKYLNDVSISVAFSNVIQRNTGLTETERFFRYSMPVARIENPRGVYNIQRGIWYAEISFDDFSHDKKNCDSLLASILKQCGRVDNGRHSECFQQDEQRNKYSNGQNAIVIAPELFLTIKGINENGALVMRRQAYKFDRLLLNYRFVPVRPYEIVSRCPDGNARNSKKTYITVHFDVVSKIKCASDEYESFNHFSKYFGKPRDIDVLKEGDCISHPFMWRIKSAFWNFSRN